MKILICVGHANYGGGVISSADGTQHGGVNEYLYNKELAPHVVAWLNAAGHEAVLCIAPEGELHNLNDEINYFMGVENSGCFDLAIQLHLNAFNSRAYGCEAYAYNDKGLEIANAICAKLDTVWHNRGGQIKKGLYWTRKTKATAVLVESFFCDNAEDYRKARDIGMSAHAKLIAEGIIGENISGGVETPEEPNGDGSNLVKVSITNLNIRKGPGTNYGVSGTCPVGTYTIVETKTAGGYTWGRLKSGAGWIALEYAKRV